MNSFKKITANNAVTTGVRENMMVAFDTSKYESVLYQQYNPEPYTVPMAMIKIILIGDESNSRLLTGKKMKYVEIKIRALKKFRKKTI